MRVCVPHLVCFALFEDAFCPRACVGGGSGNGSGGSGCVGEDVVLLLVVVLFVVVVGGGGVGGGFVVVVAAVVINAPVFVVADVGCCQRCFVVVAIMTAVSKIVAGADN